LYNSGDKSRRDAIGQPKNTKKLTLSNLKVLFVYGLIAYM